MFYLCHAWRKGVTTSCNNPRFSSVRCRNTVQRFSVAISDCVTANGDKETFIELLVTTAPFLLQEPFLSDRSKSTRSSLGHMALLTGSSLTTFQKSVLLPSSKLDSVVLCNLCVCTVLVIVARSGSGG